MPLELDVVRSAFEALSLTSDWEFHQIVEKLRHTGTEGRPDFVDTYSARLVCSALRSGETDAILIVLPDGLERRIPLLFSFALIMEGLHQLKAGGLARPVLCVSKYPALRRLLQAVRFGSQKLDEIFTQKYSQHGDSEFQPVSKGGHRLPSVLYICDPADPGDLLRKYRPKWVAADCDVRNELFWLPTLLQEAKKTEVPVIGWTTYPFSEVIHQWLASGGGVLRWPWLRRGAGARIATVEQSFQWAVELPVTPRVLVGEGVLDVSEAFAAAAESLLAARELRAGRVSDDALKVGWRYLRALELVPVPLEVYEREVSRYWGMQRIADLRHAFTRFLAAVRPLSPQLYGTLEQVAEALLQAQKQITAHDSPLWLALANLCVGASSKRRIVFGSRAARKMFSLSLLARFDITEEDLQEVDVRLGHVSGRDEAKPEELDGKGGSQWADGSETTLLVGIPSRWARRYFEALIDSENLEVLLWPHQKKIFERCVRDLSSQLGMVCHGLDHLLPGLNRVRRFPLSLAPPEVATVGVIKEERHVDKLWVRPDAWEVISGLVESGDPAETGHRYSPPPLIDGDSADSDSGAMPDTVWVQDAVELHLEGGLRLLLACDEPVNVIIHEGKQVQVEPRYVRSLRVGDEILFIHGQRRQSLYELLISRIHRDPVIGQYLALVRRWHEDLAGAFSERSMNGSITPDSLLQDLQARGSKLTSPQTIRTWLRGVVLAPNDPEDLRRVAEVLHLGFVKQYYREIARAASRLRGLHVSLSLKLNAWLGSSGQVAAAIAGGDEMIDQELGLTVNDFRHCLLRIRVLDVRQKHGLFYRPDMGRLEGGLL
jgi:hypothetical protein